MEIDNIRENNGIPRPEVTKVQDPAAERVKMDFLVFLEKYNQLISFCEVANETVNIAPSTELTSDLATEMDPSSTPLSRVVPFYRQQLSAMQKEHENTLYVDLRHLQQFNPSLALIVAEQFLRLETFLRQSLQLLVKRHAPDYLSLPNSSQLREFWISFYGVGPSATLKLRQMTTQKIGQLLCISGTVTRTSEVRPELMYGTFMCMQCNLVQRGIEQQFKYTEPAICLNQVCGNRRNWKLLLEKSSFVDWQRIHVQENSSEIPAGSMPRSIDVIVRNDLCEKAKAGDRCDFIGSLIVIPDISQLATPGAKVESQAEGTRTEKVGISGEGVSGIRGLGVRELNYKLAFMACMVQSSNKKDLLTIHEHDNDSNENADEIFTVEERRQIQRMRETPQLYTTLVDSIAPSIFGHEKIKAGVLLMLFGGVHKVTQEGINLRGDINICILGDPGTAKSQFLKYVTGFLPRSIYTSGKSSSAAGLTASVIKDEETGEFTIEAGALMLADNGICAIDEFDKMDLKDQVAIHEAMEQQTISIAKAGIQATLNARTSILAAANPIGGRYDKKKSLRQNIAMTAPILSRFDLFFVIMDECDTAVDFNIARHILSVHRYGDAAVNTVFSQQELQRYIRYAKTLKPKLTAEAGKVLIEEYKALRQNDVTAGSAYRMTVRQLESMIRLSEALARLHCDPLVGVRYVKEAVRLLRNSVVQVENDQVNIVDFDNAMQLEDKTETEPVERHQTLKYEDFVKITNFLVYFIRKSETETGEGVQKDTVIQWYLEQIEEEIDTEADLINKRLQVKGVIERLVTNDSILFEIKSDAGSGSTLLVNPNYTSKD